MTPADIIVITLDEKTHDVVTRTPITITTQSGAIEQVQYADSDGNITTADGRTSSAVAAVQGTRYTCSCGLGFDAADSDLSDPRFDQGASVNCPDC